jgi:hypothetical protein
MGKFSAFNIDLRVINEPWRGTSLNQFFTRFFEIFWLYNYYEVIRFNEFHFKIPLLSTFIYYFKTLLTWCPNTCHDCACIWYCGSNAHSTYKRSTFKKFTLLKAYIFSSRVNKKTKALKFFIALFIYLLSICEHFRIS